MSYFSSNDAQENLTRAKRSQDIQRFHVAFLLPTTLIAADAMGYNNKINQV
jgi:hypothetical protein